MAVLLPLGLLSGVPGAFFRPLAVTMSVALLVSLVLALTFTPALAAAVEPAAHAPRAAGPGDRLAAWLARFYTRALRWTLAHALDGAGRRRASFLAVAGSRTSRRDRLRAGDGRGRLRARLLGAARHVAAGDGAHAARRSTRSSQQTPEVASPSRAAPARSWASSSPRPTAATTPCACDAARGARSTRSSTTCATQIHAQRARAARRVRADPAGHDRRSRAAIPSPIEVKLFGSDQARAASNGARPPNALIAGVPGVVDNFDGITPVGPTYQIDVDEQRANLLGLNADAVQHWLETAITGTVVGQVLEGDRAIPLRLRYPGSLSRPPRRDRRPHPGGAAGPAGAVALAGAPRRRTGGRAAHAREPAPAGARHGASRAGAISGR